MSNACISSTKVAGTAVYNANGDKLGSIDDLIIDKVSGQVRYAALEFGGFLGLGTDRYPLPWSMIEVASSTLNALARAMSSSGSEISAGVILFITSAAV